jgi:hypothetical protein
MLRWLREFFLSSFGLFVGFGILPIFAGAGIAQFLGHPTAAENTLIFGWLGWIATRTLVGWAMQRSWRRSEALRIKEGRESPSDVRRRETRERERRRNKERAREVMHLLQRDGGKRSKRQSTEAAVREFHDNFRWDETADGGTGHWLPKEARDEGGG